MKQQKLHQDIYAGLGIILGAMAFFAYSFTISNDNGAALFPRMLLAAIACLGAWIIAGGVKKTRAARSLKEEISHNLMLRILRVPAFSYLYLIGYVVVYYLFGYMIATGIFLIAFMRYLNVKSWKVSIPITLGYLAFVYVVFYAVFGIRIMNLGRVGLLMQGI